MAKVFIENEVENFEVDGDTKNMIEEVVEACLAEEEISYPFEINILLLDNPKIRVLNNDFRNIDKETDVLSFPFFERNEIEYYMGHNVDDGMGETILGDIVISIDKANEQANEYGHSFTREFMFLLTHGMFHILGYDHEIEGQENVMFEKQEKVLEKLGIGR